MTQTKRPPANPERFIIVEIEIAERLAGGVMNGEGVLELLDDPGSGKRRPSGVAKS